MYLHADLCRDRPLELAPGSTAARPLFSSTSMVTVVNSKADVLKARRPWVVKRQPTGRTRRPRRRESIESVRPVTKRGSASSGGEPQCGERAAGGGLKNRHWGTQAVPFFFSRLLMRLCVYRSSSFLFSKDCPALRTFLETIHFEANKNHWKRGCSNISRNRLNHFTGSR